MKKTITLLLLSFVTFTLLGQNNTYTAEKNQDLTWKGKAALGSYAPEGTLTISSASIACDMNDITSLEITVDMKSLYQENQQLMNHLKEEDFFYVKKYPKATFILIEASKIEDGKVRLEGEMTIRGITKKEIIDATLTEIENGVELQFSKKFNRTDYGVNHNSPSIFKRLKENAIDDFFNLKGQIVFK